MKESIVPISQRETYTPNEVTLFLWWLSTAEKELLKESVIDRNRYKIIGTTVLATWLFATLSWTYFFSTIVTSLVIAIGLGIFMGFIILTIDRALIKGITRHNKRKILPLIFRGVLALTIGTFMAQPVVLYMFDKEIQLQTSLDNEKKRMLKTSEVTALYKNRKDELVRQIASLKAEEKNKYDAVQKERQNYLSETDGSGGTGKVGIKDIAIAKRNEYEKLDKEYQQLTSNDKPKLDSAEAGLAIIDHNIKNSEDAFTKYFNNGFLTRVEALNNLLKDNAALQFRYYLIVFILMLIELMPVISKMLLPSGSYDEKVLRREEMEIEITNSNILREQQLKQLYNQLAHENDAEAIRSFFEISKGDRNEKIRSLSQKWKEEAPKTFDGLWEKIKQDILSKQEN